MRARRKAIAGSSRQALEHVWLSQALQSGYFRPNQNIAAYFALGSELSLDGFFKLALARGIRLYLPRVRQNQALTFCRYTAQCLRMGELGVLEPEGHVLPWDAIDVFLIPLLAADTLGQRLGQGGGYFDRTLPLAAQAQRIGVCFDQQLLAEPLPNEAFDQRLDALITPTGWRWFTQNHRAEVRCPAQEQANRH